MTKYSINLDEHRKILLDSVTKFNAVVEKPEDRQDFDDIIQKYHADLLDDKVAAVICRVARVLACHMKEFYDTLQNANLKRDFLTKPVDGKLIAFMRSKTPGNVVVFPNIFFNTVDEDAYVDINGACSSSVYNYYAVDRLIAEYKKSDKRGWNPLRRAIKRLTVRQEISLSAYATRYTSAKANKLTDAQIRDWAEDVSDIFKPVELTFADTPEDFVKMYGNADGPSSCMTMHEPRPWKFMLDEWKIHPTSFYAYHPHTRGAYMAKGKKIVARCIVYETAPGKWEAGRMYFNNAAIATKFMEGLKKHNISCDKGRELQYKRDFKFTIPVFKSKSGSGIPMPYIDNMCIGLKIKDKGDHVQITSNPDGSLDRLRSAAGFIPCNKLKVATCQHCGRSVGDRPLITQDEFAYAFCSELHAAAEGYEYIYDSEGGRRLLPAGNATIIPNLEGGVRKFTNFVAAVRNGAGPVARLDEELELTVEDEDLDVHISDNSGYGFANGYKYKRTIFVEKALVCLGVIRKNYKKEIDLTPDAPLVVTCDDYTSVPSAQVDGIYPEAPKKSPKAATKQQLVGVEPRIVFR